MITRNFCRKAALLFALTPLLAAVSCSRVPQATSYGFSTQHKMQSVNHWNILARDTADQLVREFPAILPVAPSCIYITPDDSTFGKAFNKLLKTNLFRNLKNGPIEIQDWSDEPPVDSGCIQIDFSAQVIKHRTERSGQTFPPGKYTFLTSAVMVMRDFAWYEALVGAGIIADIIDVTANSITHNEILITTKVTSAKRLLSMRSDMYYINDLDTWHYEKPKQLSAKQFQAVGGAKE